MFVCKHPHNPIILVTVHTCLHLYKGTVASCPLSLKSPLFFLEEVLHCFGPGMRCQVFFLLLGVVLLHQKFPIKEQYFDLYLCCLRV